MTERTRTDAITTILDGVRAGAVEYGDMDTVTEIDAAMTDYIALLDEHERLRNALAYYASIGRDGERARAALEPEAQP